MQARLAGLGLSEVCPQGADYPRGLGLAQLRHGHPQDEADEDGRKDHPELHRLKHVSPKTKSGGVPTRVHHAQGR